MPSTDVSLHALSVAVWLRVVNNATAILIAKLIKDR
jgi:hypothetical protein